MSTTGPVVVLAGGTGGAKLARGMRDVVERPEDLVVIGNTGDDIEIYGGYVSPDPDLITFSLADRIDARGWGLEGDTFNTMDGLRELGVDVWFNLGDRDLAVCLERARMLAAGARPTEAQARIARAFGVKASVLPMSDAPVRTRIIAGGRSWSLQQFLIVAGGAGPIDDVAFVGARNAHPSPEVLTQIATARAIIIGPSNPVISIGPILAVNSLREAICKSPAPVVAVSPIVKGEIIKGPTDTFMEWAGQELSPGGIAQIYAGVIDGLVADDRTDLLPVLQTDVLMADADARRRLAAETLSFALALG